MAAQKGSGVEGGRRRRKRTRLAARLSIQVVPYHKLSARGPPSPPLPYNSFHSYVTAYVATYVRRLVCPAGTQPSTTGTAFSSPPVAPAPKSFYSLLCLLEGRSWFSVRVALFTCCARSVKEEPKMNAHGSHTGSKETDGFVAAVPSQLGLPSIRALPAPFFLFLSLSLLSLSPPLSQILVEIRDSFVFANRSH